MKKKFLHIVPARYFILFLLLALLANKHSLAQKVSLSDFAVYANPDTTSKDFRHGSSANDGVEIHSNSKILSGNVGSYYSIKTTGPVNIYGDMHSANIINLAWNNIVKGNITSAGKNCGYNQNAFAAGNGFLLQGNLDIKGNISVSKYSNSAINGTVTHPAGTYYKGPAPLGGEVIANPVLPILPANAPITNFKAAGKKDITKTQTLTPGAYGEIKLNGNSTITFSGPGVYIFSSISNTGFFNNFVFDFKNSPDGVFQLQIQGDVNLGKFQAILKNGGNASRIYAETHGDGRSCHYGMYAWSMENCSKYRSTWKGTIYAPYGGINIGSSSGRSEIEGALWSRKKIIIKNGVEIKLAAFQSCIPPDADAGDDRVVACTDSSTVILNGSSATPDVTYSWQAIDSGHIVSGASTAKPVVSKAGAYVLTITAPGGCAATDTVIVTSSCIVPYYPPPDGGKTTDVIGSELNALYDNFGTVQDTMQNIFVILSDSVLIDIVAK